MQRLLWLEIPMICAEVDFWVTLWKRVLCQMSMVASDELALALRFDDNNVKSLGNSDMRPCNGSLCSGDSKSCSEWNRKNSWSGQTDTSHQRFRLRASERFVIILSHAPSMMGDRATPCMSLESNDFCWRGYLSQLSFRCFERFEHNHIIRFPSNDHRFYGK